MNNDLEILRKFRDDFLHYAPRVLKIRSKDGAIVPLSLNTAQTYVHSQLEAQLKATGKIRALVLKGRQQGMCLDPNTKVLTADLRWIPIKSVTIGQKLVATDENPTPGLGKGNGSQKMRTSVVEKVWKTKKLAYRITFDDGRSVVCSAQHRWYSRKSQAQAKWRSISGEGSRATDGREALVVGNLIRSISEPWAEATMEDAWFGGMIDGEGSLDYKTRSGADLAISQVDGPVLERMKAHCIERGYKHCIVSDDGPRRTKLGLRPVRAISISNIPDVLRLCGQSRPTRFISKDWWEGKRPPEGGWRKIVSIEPLREQVLIDIQTSTGTFLAEGFLSHNSTYIGARFFWKTSLAFGKQASILTHLQDSTDALFDMTRRYHELCPEVLKPETSAASAKELRFSALDSGYIVATAGSKATGRGRTIQYMHGSELAFWPNAEEHLAGIGQAVPDLPGTEVVFESTANGVGNLFHQMWIDAEKGKGDYLPVFVPWFWQAEYRKEPPAGFALDDDERMYASLYQLDDAQMLWRRQKMAGDFRGDAALFCQEYPATAAEAFRRVSGDPLINPEHVAEARKTKVDAGAAPLVFGLDPAEYGSDDTALVMRRGRKVERVLRWNGKGTMETVGIVGKLADTSMPFCINVDCTGVGSGVADRLMELGYPVNRIHFGERAIEPAQYINRRAEMWGLMREWLADKPSELPDDDLLESELCAPQYGYDSSRRLKLESKEDMRKRGISSPDAADALALTFAVPVYAPLQEGERARSWRAKSKPNWRA